MSNFQKISLFLLRLFLGSLFFYAGVTKVINPNWSAVGYLNSAQTFSGFYNWLTQPGLLPITNFLNEWGLTLIGLAVIFGVFTRLSALLGATMMILYYFPVLAFPYAGEHSFIVDEHIIYAVGFLILASTRAGRVWGFDIKLMHSGSMAKWSRLRNILG